MERNKKLYGYRVRYIDGITRDYKKAIGFCHNICHKGFVTPKLLLEHECLERECKFLERIKEHEYWKQIQKDEKHKSQVKKTIKKNKQTEKLILEKAKEVSADNSEIVMCKHLYDSTFILIVIKSDYHIVLPQEFIEEHGIHVYIKSIYERQRSNIKYTYKLLLPDNMREKLINKK